MQKPKNILIVEDDKISLMILEHLIKQLLPNSHIDIAIDGLYGLDKVTNKCYDLIFTDIMMPRMNGIEMIHTIRKISDIPIIIVVSGYIHKDEIIKNVWYTEKPLNVDKLKEILKGIKCIS